RAEGSTMTTVRIDEQAQTLIIAGTGPKPATGSLDGPRARVDAKITGGGKTWKAAFALRASRWGGDELPLPSGEYELHVEGVDLGSFAIGPELLAGLRIELNGAQVQISPPLAPIYESDEGQSILEGRYVAQT